MSVRSKQQQQKKIRKIYNHDNFNNICQLITTGYGATFYMKNLYDTVNLTDMAIVAIVSITTIKIHGSFYGCHKTWKAENVVPIYFEGPRWINAQLQEYTQKKKKYVN